MTSKLILRDANMRAAKYHADPAPEPSLSASMAQIMETQSPLHAHAKHPRLGATATRKDTDALDEGTLIHQLLLEPDGGEDIWILDHDSYRKAAAKQDRDEARENGATPVLRKDHDRATVAAERIRARLLEEHGIDLTAGEVETSIVWREELEERPSRGDILRRVDGDPVSLHCRSRLDAVQGRVIYDLKKTRSAAPEDVAKAIANYGYSIQQAAYTSALEAAEPEFVGVVDFVFVFVETFEPFCVVPYRLDAIFAEYGARQWQHAQRTWAECLASGKWPGYQVQRITPPGWILSRLALY